MADKTTIINRNFGFVNGVEIKGVTGEQKRLPVGTINSIDMSLFDVSLSLDESNKFGLYKFNSEHTLESVGITKNDTELKCTYFEIKNDNSKIAVDSQESKKDSTNLESDSASYELLRTNPKLTGNIKVVIDSSSNIFIDTFKVNNTLSKEKYRKVPVSYKEYYGNNIMFIFRNVTSDDLYYVEKNHHSIFTVTNTYKEQYDDTYRSGATTNSDKLYKENFSLLAPLKVGSVLPDFFVILKYENMPYSGYSSSGTLRHLLSEGTQVAFFDFREGTKLGTYLRRIEKEQRKFQGEAYISKNKDYDNIFSGISVDKGVISNVYESVYFNKSKNKVANDNYFTKAYERHRLISPNIINFEYMFDDNDCGQFATNTYVGLYLKFNDLSGEVNCSEKDSSGNYKYTENGNPVDSSNLIYTAKFDSDIIEAYISNDWFRRKTELNKNNILDDAILNNENSIYRYGKNILSGESKQVDIKNEGYKSFMNIYFNDIQKVGEHYRVICHSNSDIINDTIFEIILSDNKQYEQNEYGISDEIINNYSHIYKLTESDTETRELNLHRLSVYISEDYDIKYITKCIYKALNSFTDAPFKVISYGDTFITLCEKDDSEYKYLDFQKISDILFTESDIPSTSGIYSKISEDKMKMSFFGEFNPTPLIINPMDASSWVYNYSSDDLKLCYCPVHFETLGSRLTYIGRFVNINGNDIYNINTPSNKDLINKNFIIYQDNRLSDNPLTSYTGFSIKFLEYDSSYNVSEIIHNKNIVKSMTNENLSMICLNSLDSAYSVLDKINAYLPYNISYGICGIFNIKDFNFNVLDKDASLGKEDTEKLTNYISLDNDVLSYTGTDIDSSFYKDIYNNGRRFSDISLTSPYNLKWVSKGTDSNGNDLRLMYSQDSSLCLNDASIKDLPLNNDNIDVTKIFENGKTIREEILNGNLSIQNLIYDSSINDSSTKVIENVKTYTLKNSAIEFIYRGMKISINLENIDIINSTSLLNSNIYVYETYKSSESNEWDILIDLNSKTILLLHYGLQRLKMEINGTEDNPTNVIDNIPDTSSLFWESFDINLDFKDCYIDSSGNLASLKKDNTYYPNRYDDPDAMPNVIVDAEKFTIVGLLNKGDSSVIIENPVLYTMSGKEPLIAYLTNNLLEEYCLHPDTIKSYAITYNGEILKNGITISGFDVSDSGLFVKDGDGKYEDYTNAKTMSVNPKTADVETVYDYYEKKDVSVHYFQTYYYPETYNILIFKSLDSSSILKNEKSANIKLDSIKNPEQMWIRKKSDNANYCFGSKMRRSIDVLTNYKLSSNSLYPRYYKNYKRDASNNYITSSVDGFAVGYLQKTFFNSLGILIKNDTIKNVEIVMWTESIINDGKLYFNITSSLMNKIINSYDFNKIWNKLKVQLTDYKRNYIKNTILPKIEITSKNKITVYFKESDKLRLSSRFSDDFSEIDNVKTELINRNGCYYVELTPNANKIGTYYIKYKIDL